MNGLAALEKANPDTTGDVAVVTDGPGVGEVMVCSRLYHCEFGFNELAVFLHQVALMCVVGENGVNLEGGGGRTKLNGLRLRARGAVNLFAVHVLDALDVVKILGGLALAREGGIHAGDLPERVLLPTQKEAGQRFAGLEGEPKFGGLLGHGGNADIDSESDGGGNLGVSQGLAAGDFAFVDGVGDFATPLAEDSLAATEGYFAGINGEVVNEGGG